MMGHLLEALSFDEDCIGGKSGLEKVSLRPHPNFEFTFWLVCC